MEKDFIHTLFNNHSVKERFPSSKAICEFTSLLLQILFPALSEKHYDTWISLENEFKTLRIYLVKILSEIGDDLNSTPEMLTDNFMFQIPYIYAVLKTDIAAIVKGDPAARNEFEVTRAYPGFYAIGMYRIAHELYNLNIAILPRIITEFAHSKTGIDIHPGADIGKHFCIDHGTGIVIGETSTIGDNVKLYQGVTLGALSVDKSMAKNKRHPTLENNVVIYSGATILGGNTIIGHNSIIGGNVWLTKSVAPFSTVYYKAQIEVGHTPSNGDLTKI